MVTQPRISGVSASVAPRRMGDEEAMKRTVFGVMRGSQSTKSVLEDTVAWPLPEGAPTPREGFSEGKFDFAYCNWAASVYCSTR
jgi:hypothetical protein